MSTFRPGSINMEWMIYMSQPCGTSVAEVHKMTTEAIESSNNVELGAVKVEAIESVSMARIVGKWTLLDYTTVDKYTFFLKGEISRNVLLEWLLVSYITLSGENNCRPGICQNNGTCVDENDGYLCACVEGFHGENCQLVVPQQPEPCPTQELPTSGCPTQDPCPVCPTEGQCPTCPTQEPCPTQERCPTMEPEVDHCTSSSCMNGGICVNTAGGNYTCLCRNQWTGTSCETG